MPPRALDHLDALMKEHLVGQEMAFIATSDGLGSSRASVQTGPPGFVRVLDDRSLLFPGYAGDSAGPARRDITRSPHIGLVFVDPGGGGAGVQIHGPARLVEHAAVEAFAPLLGRVAGLGRIEDLVDGRRGRPEVWVLVDIVEARMIEGAASSDGQPAPSPVPSAPFSPPAPPDQLGPPVAPAAGPADDDELSYLLPAAWADNGRH